MITNLINSKVYVGQTKNFANRKAGHLYGAKRGCNRPLYRSIRKYGVENFKFEVIEECEDDVVNEREQHWVSHYDSFNPEQGYNLTTGGNQNFTFSAEVKKRMSENNRGENNPMYGKKSPGMLGKRHSEESIKKMSGENAGMFGKSGVLSPTYGTKAHKSPRSKLTKEQVVQIIELIQTTNLSNQKIANVFGVSKQTIMYIRDGRSTYVQSPG